MSADLRAFHKERPRPPYRGTPRQGTMCATDQQQWPCDVALLLDALAAAQDERLPNCPWCGHPPFDRTHGCPAMSQDAPPEAAAQDERDASLREVKTSIVPSPKEDTDGR